MTDEKRLAAALGRTFGQGLRVLPVWPVVAAAVAEYRQRRRRATRPLRQKPITRLKTIPAVGPMREVLQDALHARQMTLRDVRGVARIRRSTGGFCINATVLKARKAFPGPVLKHTSSATIFGVAVTEEGLTVDAATLKHHRESECSTRELREGVYKVSVEAIIAGKLPAIFERCIKPTGLLIGLDLSALPALSNRSRHAAMQAFRWFRSRQAVGAIDFRAVSTLGGEAQVAVERLERRGAPMGDSLAARATTLLNCPECGRSIVAHLSPTTGAPVGATCPCSARRQGGDFMGRALARRAAVQALDGQRQMITRGHYDPRTRAKLS